MNAQIIQCKILSWPRVLYSEKHQIKFIWKTPLIGLIDILFLKKGKFDLEPGSWKTGYRLFKRKILFYFLYLPSFFLVFYISQK